MGYLQRIAGPGAPLRRQQVAAAAGLSLLFMVVYGATNQLASLRTDLGTIGLPWEPKVIPFVPIFIIPYMSIDLFFVGAPFLCASRAELRVFSYRIAAAILIVGAFFLFMPLTFASARPVPDGWTAPIFRFLHGFDQPHNLFPSLHITLRTILAYTYARHTRGPLRGILHFWFFLIGLSTLLTYQHHLLDVYGGFLLAVVVFHLYREEATPAERSTNPRIGGYYATGALAVLALTVLTYPLGLLLLWPATALGFMAAGYFRFGGAIYRKHDGRLSFPARLLFAPVLLGQYLSLLYYRRQCNDWDEVAPNVVIGRVLSDVEARRAVDSGITAVLDLTSEFEEARPFRELPYLNLPILDLTPPTQSQIDQAATFIAEQCARGKVYVHCKIGYSRSVAAVGAYLLRSGQASSVLEAIDAIRQSRPSIVARPEVRRALDAFASRIAQTTNT